MSHGLFGRSFVWPVDLPPSMRAEQMAREDAALVTLAKNHNMDVTQKDWLRTLCLCLAIEHEKDFFKSAGGYSMSIFRDGTGTAGLLGNAKATVQPRPARGARSKKWRQHEREDAVLGAASRMKRSTKMSAEAIAHNLRKRKWIVPGDRRPLSKKVLCVMLRNAIRRYQKTAADARRYPEGGILGDALGLYPLLKTPKNSG